MLKFFFLSSLGWYIYGHVVSFQFLYPESFSQCTKVDSMNHISSSSLIRSGKKPWQLDFCEFYMNVCFSQIFVEFSKILLKRKEKKWKLTGFYSTYYQRRRNMGLFKNPLWCTVDVTQGAKIENWQRGHKCTNLRNSEKKEFEHFHP